MQNIDPALKFFMNLAKIQAIMLRRFDGRLRGLGFNEFMILFHLSQAHEEKLRRVDLAEKIGLTASGVTRLLVPMEKIGLVKREINEMDGRVSWVALTPGGKAKLADSLESAEIFSQEVIPAATLKKLEKASEVLSELGGSIA